MVASPQLPPATARPRSTAAGSGAAAAKQQQRAPTGPTAGRVERFVKEHPHPLGLGSQKGAWPVMRDLPLPQKDVITACDGCCTSLRSDASERFGEGHLRCGLGCPWRLCSACAAAAPEDEDGRKKHLVEVHRLPLHYQLRDRQDRGEIAALLAANPGAVAEKDESGKLPLHWAVASNAPIALVAALLAANQEAAAAKDGDGKLPLHLAAAHSASVEVVEALLEANPFAAAERDRGGKVPLHWAVAKSSFEVVAALLAASQAAAAQTDAYGMLPLHCAVEAKASLAVVEALLAANEAAAAETCCGSQLPLHLAAISNASLQVVAALLAANTEAAKEADDGGKSPLHIAAESGAPIEVVAALLAANPRAAAQRDRAGRLPLHYAAQSRAPLEVVVALLAAHPDAAAAKGRDGKLPLHCAAEERAPLAVVVALLAASPRAADEADEEGRLPLHFAAQNKASVEVVAALLAANPGAAAERDAAAKLPLHYAAQSNASVEVVSALLAAYPGAAKEKGADGRLPLHWAAQGHVSREMVAALLTVNQAAAAQRDAHGMLPLHLAAASSASLEVVMALLASHPAGAAETNRMGAFPLHCAAGADAPIAVMSALLAANPRGVRQKDGAGKLPLQWAAEKQASLELVSLLVAACLSAAVERDEYADAVYCAVKADQSLAYTSHDEKGRPAINLATGRCREMLFKALFFLGRYEIITPHKPKHRSATCVVLFAIDHSTAGSSAAGDAGDGDLSGSSGGGGGGGSGKPVALKLMRNSDQFERERTARGSATGPGEASGPALDGAFVLPLLHSTALGAGDEFTLDGVAYGYLLVLERADDDLAGEIAHACMQVGTARAVARSVGRCLQHMHERGRCHGDLKPLNVVRVSAAALGGSAGRECRWKLIDLDAAASIGTGYLGMKSSTAYMPPESLFLEDAEEIRRRAAAEAEAEESQRLAAAATEAQDGAEAAAAGPDGPAAMAAAAAASAVPGGGGAARLCARECARACGSGWRVRAVDETGEAVDPLARGLFEPLKAHPSFDLWSFGCLLYEMLCRETIWHSDADGNVSRASEHSELAAWSDAAKRACLGRVPDRWAHALLDRLLAKEPCRRPAGMAAVLAHPFFTQAVRREAPALGEGLTSHGFLSHFQGNAGPRVMTIKLAVEGAVPGAKLWLDQDQADKTATGMLDGVRSSRFFVLVLTRCYFARWFCQLELQEALKNQKHIILIREMDARHGACQQLPQPPAVRCAKCSCAAAFGPPGALWPSLCGDHSREEAGCVEVALSPAVSSDALNGSLIYDELVKERFVVSAAALELASGVLGAAGSGASASGATGSGPAGSGVASTDAAAGGAGPVTASVSWLSEAEFRDVSLSKLLAALGMERPEINGDVAAAAAAAAAGASAMHAQAAAAAGGSEAGVLLATFTGLACGVPAPALGHSNTSHVSIISAAASQPSCAALKAALEGSFEGAIVALPEEAAGMTAAAESAQCVLVFLTVGMLRAGAPQLAALAAALRRGTARTLLVHETDLERGGALQFGDYLEEARASRAEHDVMAVFGDATSIPWYRDPDNLPVCALKLFVDGVMGDAPVCSVAPPPASASPFALGVETAPAAAAAEMLGLASMVPAQLVVESDLADLKTKNEALEAECSTLKAKLAALIQQDGEPADQARRG